MRNRHISPKRPFWHVLIGVGVLGLLTVYGILPVLRAGWVAHPLRKALPDLSTIPFDDEEVTFATPEGLPIYGWYIPSQNHAAIILVHGYNGNRADYLEPAQMLAENGYGVLMIDLLAHGESEGKTLNLDGTEVLASVAYLKARPDVDAQRIGARCCWLPGSRIAANVASCANTTPQPEPAQSYGRSPEPVTSRAGRSAGKTMKLGRWHSSNERS